MRQAALTTLPAQTILLIMQRFCQLHPLPKTRGRPRQYPEALIFALTLMRVRDQASWRQRLYALAPERLPNHDLPALSTLVYRMHIISDERWHHLLAWLARQGIALERPTTETPSAVVDGTGVGYATPFYAQFCRVQRYGGRVRM